MSEPNPARLARLFGRKLSQANAHKSTYQRDK